MVHAVAPPTIQDIATDAAAGPVLVEYMALRGIKTPATLALLAQSESELERVLVQPLLNGWTKDDSTVLSLSENEKPIAKAVFLHMWQVARQYWTKQMAASVPSPTVTPAASAASSSSGESKVPKTLAPGKWTAMITAYQSQQLGGRDRVFPVNELLGTESVLARVVHELEVSKQFTPIQLGELISLRTFLPTGEPNPLSKKEKTSTKLHLTGESLVATPDEPWQPRSVLAVIDGLQSIRWAYVLTSMGSEQAIEAFFNWLVRLARSRPQKTEQFGAFWLAMSWKLAKLRAGRTFDEVTPELMRDYDLFTECMARDPAPPQKRATTPTRSSEPSKGSGKGNNKSGKSARTSPYQRSTKQWSSGGDRYDRSFQKSNSYQADDKPSWSRDTWTNDWQTPRKG